MHEEHASPIARVIDAWLRDEQGVDDDELHAYECEMKFGTKENVPEALVRVALLGSDIAFLFVQQVNGHFGVIEEITRETFEAN